MEPHLAIPRTYKAS